VPVVLPDTCKEAIEVDSGELPVEGPGGGVVMLVEGEDLAASTSGSSKSSGVRSFAG
jgi:hypothetical protein